MNTNFKLTSVKVLNENYINFKKEILTTNSNTTLQKLVNTCLELYTSDKDFRDKIDKSTISKPQKIQE